MIPWLLWWRPVGLAASLGALCLCLNGTISTLAFAGTWAGSLMVAALAEGP